MRKYIFGFLLTTLNVCTGAAKLQIEFCRATLICCVKTVNTNIRLKLDETLKAYISSSRLLCKIFSTK